MRISAGMEPGRRYERQDEAGDRIQLEIFGEREVRFFQNGKPCNATVEDIEANDWRPSETDAERASRLERRAERVRRNLESLRDAAARAGDTNLAATYRQLLEDMQ